MRSALGHLQVNVHPENMGFYKELFIFLGWSMIYEKEFVTGFSGCNGANLWFKKGIKALANDYDGMGTNHIAISVEHQKDIDLVVGFLEKRNIHGLFGTPCYRPERANSPAETMYHVMFESPDKLLFEVVYKGPKDE